jgi:hypothetical protein
MAVTFEYLESRQLGMKCCMEMRPSPTMQSPMGRISCAGTSWATVPMAAN